MIVGEADMKQASGGRKPPVDDKQTRGELSPPARLGLLRSAAAAEGELENLPQDNSGLQAFTRCEKCKER